MRGGHGGAPGQLRPSGVIVGFSGVTGIRRPPIKRLNSPARRASGMAVEPPRRYASAGIRVDTAAGKLYVAFPATGGDDEEIAVDVSPPRSLPGWRRGAGATTGTRPRQGSQRWARGS